LNIFCLYVVFKKGSSYLTNNEKWNAQVNFSGPKIFITMARKAKTFSQGPLKLTCAEWNPHYKFKHMFHYAHSLDRLHCLIYVYTKKRSSLLCILVPNLWDQADSFYNNRLHYSFQLSKQKARNKAFSSVLDPNSCVQIELSHYHRPKNCQLFRHSFEYNKLEVWKHTC